MARICVFCGSSFGEKQAYREAAHALGEAIAAQGLGLVYGGASVGLMGTVADAALAAGGEVIGVLPKSLHDVEIGHTGLSKLHIVDSMHERKALMADLSDAFAVLPGGIGTLEEAFEVWTWSQLGIHQKSLGLLNVAGFYDRLEGFLDHVTSEGFVRPIHRDMLISEQSAVALVESLLAAEAPGVKKWVDPINR